MVGRGLPRPFRIRHFFLQIQFAVGFVRRAAGLFTFGRTVGLPVGIANAKSEHAGYGKFAFVLVARQRAMRVAVTHFAQFGGCEQNTIYPRDS